MQKFTFQGENLILKRMVGNVGTFNICDEKWEPIRDWFPRGFLPTTRILSLKTPDLKPVPTQLTIF